MIIWTKQKFKDICERVDYGFTASATRSSGGPKFLRITDITSSSINWETVPYCQIPENEEEKYLLADGDIVVARTGATTGFAKCLVNPPKSIFASYLVRFRVNKSNDKHYIGQIIESDLYKKFITSNLGGSAQPQANARVLGSYELYLPDKETQSKIADVISAYNNLMSNNEKRIKILEEMAQRLYTEWFVKFKFPGHEKVKMADSSLGKIPDSWESKTIGSLLDTVKRKTKIKTSEYLSSGLFPIVDQGKDEIAGFTDNKETIYSENLIVFGDHTRVVRYCNFPFACGADGTQLLKTNNFDHMPQILFYYTILNSGLQNYHYARHFKFLKALKVIVPNINTAKIFEEKVKSNHDLILELRKVNRKLERIRDLLIPQLVTGRRILQ